MTPTPAENLSIDANTEQRNSAISACISQLMNERPDMAQDQATAICIDMANKSMGTQESTDGGSRRVRPQGPGE